MCPPGLPLVFCRQGVGRVLFPAQMAAALALSGAEKRAEPRLLRAGSWALGCPCQGLGPCPLPPEQQCRQEDTGSEPYEGNRTHSGYFRQKSKL